VGEADVRSALGNDGHIGDAMFLERFGVGAILTINGKSILAARNGGGGKAAGAEDHAERLITKEVRRAIKEDHNGDIDAHFASLGVDPNEDGKYEGEFFTSKSNCITCTDDVSTFMVELGSRVSFINSFARAYKVNYALDTLTTPVNEFLIMTEVFTNKGILVEPRTPQEVLDLTGRDLVSTYPYISPLLRSQNSYLPSVHAVLRATAKNGISSNLNLDPHHIFQPLISLDAAKRKALGKKYF